MKQSVDLMNSMKLMNSRHRNTTTTTSLARRALLLLTLLVMSVGSAWGQTFGGTLAANGKTHPYYLGTGVPSPLNLNVLDYVSLSEIVSDMTEVAGTSITQDDLKSNLYVRWCIEKDDATLMTLDQYNACKAKWGFENQQGGTWYGKYGESNKFYIFAQQYYDARNTWLPADNFSPLFNAKITFINTGWGETGTLDDFAGYKIVCYVGRYAASDISLNLSGESTLVKEPTNFDIRYEFMPGKKPDTFSGALKSGAPQLTGGAVVGKADVLSDVSTTSTTLDLSAALAEVSGAKYARIYLIKDGDAVDPTGKLTVTGGTAGPEVEHGFYISKPAGLTASDLSGVTLDLTAGVFEDYQVMCVFSTDEATTLPTKEPDWDLQYTYAFEYPFKGDATSATKEEKTFKLPASQWTTSPKEFSIDFDFTNSKIFLKDKDNSATLASVDFDKMWWDTNYSGASVSGKNFYIRWFLKSKSTGAEYYIANSIRNITGASTYKDCAKAQYGCFWSTKIDDGQTNLNDIMRIKIDGTPASPGAEFDVRDYDLVCTIGTDGTETLDGSKQVTMEPATLQMQYTFHFEEPEFPADNINTVKTIYKTALYDKTTGKITPVLFGESGYLTDCEVSLSAFQSDSYARWYVVEKSTGKIVSDLSDWGFAIPTTADNPNYGNTAQYYSKLGFGWYATPVVRYGATDGRFDPKITLPSGYNLTADYKDYDVVCVVSTNTSDMISETVEWVPTVFHEPTLKVKYVFNLMASDELETLPFVHYKGQSGRDWTKPEGSNGNMAQKVWNTATGVAEDFTGDIRQGVHTWEYNVYVKTDDERELILPIEKYTEGSNNLEPRAYFRWYDYLTDRAVAPSENYTFTNAGSKLNVTDRGSFALNIGENPKQANVGVTFTAKSGFPDTGIHIACDVSKYSDGILDISGTSYLQHEPTLSTRYIFHIYPATVISSELATAKTTLEDAETVAISSGKLSDMETALANLPENKGKMVVSLGEGNTGEFALRLDEHSIANYVLENGTVTPTVVNWYAYVEYDGKVYCKKLNTSDNSDRIRSFEYTDFTGDYTELGSTATKSISDAAKYHVVVYVGEGTYKPETKTGTYAPVAHYELHFLEAPPVAVENLKNNKLPLNRTDEYMNYHYRRAGLVDFDGNPETDYRVTEENKNEYYSTEHWYDPPTSSANNMTWMPREWDDIQYGFCYPQLTSTIKNGAGDLYVSPEHGDYIMLKSMNASGISSEMNTPPHYYHWWKTDELYDYTHTYTDDTKYGSFLYTDASNESRSIATIPFTGTLCAGSMLYFTAAVADMTSGGIKPQLVIRIYGIKGDGTRESLVAFHTCDIITAGASTGEWYQVYGESVVPTTFDNSITSFVAEVINYANDTNGADFAIDQIAVYVSTAKVKALFESSSLCDESNKIRIFADAENLRNSIGTSSTKNIYYRLFERIGDADHNTHNIMEKEALVGTGVYSDDPAAPTGYGVVQFNPSYNISELTTTKPADSGYYIGDDGSVMFQLANREFGLDPSKIYFVSIYSLTEDKPGDTVAEDSQASGWGCPYNGEECTVYSNDINAQKIFIQLKEGSNDVSGSVSIGCGATSVPKNYNLVLKYPKITGGHTEHEEIKFDIFLGSRNEFKAAQTSDNLKDALDNFRTTYTTQSYTSSADLPSAYQTAQPAYYAAIKKYMDDGKLVLQASTAFSHTFTDTDNEVRFCVEPIQKKLSDDSEICSPIEMIFNVSTGGGGPEMVLGFDDVDYSVAPAKRGVRVGLEQLAKMRKATDGYKLHIPVAEYKDRDQSHTRKLYFTSGELTISETNDPTVSVGTKVAKIDALDGGATPYVNNTSMYLSLDLSGSNCEVTFHEGYYYEVSTSFYDENEASTPEADRCNSDLFLIIKVVPEFATWNAKRISDTDPQNRYNVNWYNDDNWRRSVRSDLYKDENFTGKKQNTATPGHPEGYSDNSELNTLLTSNPGYVPMKFTYVTMLTDNHAPSLIGETYETSGSDQTGGHLILLSNTMTTDTSPIGDNTYNSEATGGRHGIRYDLLVRYGDHAEGGEGCFGHRYLDGTEWKNGSETGDKVFDCEKFYGNICKEIYFKPGAELLQQQRLTYEKAWVEKEMVANKWYLMSSPLKGTYAGDMYVPMAMTDVSDDSQAKGRQVTEAFQPITFTDVYSASNPTGLYSRTKYPIYQRSWGITTSKVYTTTDDVRKTDYSTYLKWGGLSTTTAEWSHTYNDVQVPYNTIGGFSIRAHKQDQTSPALIRLPKNDVSYDYYQYNSETASSGGINQTVTKSSSEIGKFVFDKTSMDLDKVEFSLDGLQAQGTDGSNNTYYLIGNPFMGSIDMGEFFAQNTAFGGNYYTYEDGTLTAVDATGTPSSTSKHIIKPLQAFFVKCVAGSAPDKITFHRSMMTDGNYEIGTVYNAGNSTLAPSREFTLTASSNRGQSAASVSVGEEEKSVETLFDSNLTDVPMVYTVADGQAVSINQVKELSKPIAFGVTCTASNEMVDVTFSDIEKLTSGEVYVVDAVDGTSQQIYEGDSFAVQPNDYGRYFLTFTGGSATGIEETASAQQGIVVSVRGREVTVTSGEEISQIQAVSLNGSTIYQNNSCGNSVTFMLHTGVYVIQAKNIVGAQQNVKIFVK